MHTPNFFTVHSRTSRELKLAALWALGTFIYATTYLILACTVKSAADLSMTSETFTEAVDALTVISSNCKKLGAEQWCIGAIERTIDSINYHSNTIYALPDYYMQLLIIFLASAITASSYFCIMPPVILRLCAATKKCWTIHKKEPNRNSKMIRSCFNIASSCLSVLTFPLLLLTPVLLQILATVNHRDASSSAITNINNYTHNAGNDCMGNPCYGLLQEFMSNNTNSLASIPNASLLEQFTLSTILPAIAFLVMGTGICIKLFQSYRKDTLYRAPYASLN